MSDPSPAHPSHSRPSRRHHFLAIGAVAVAAVTLAVTLGKSSAAEDHYLRGIIHLTGDAGSEVSPCNGTGGYSDIRYGAPVVVSDGAGKVIAKTSLAYGQRDGVEGTCRITFSAYDVPDVNFYSVKISHRDALTFSRAELTVDEWEIELFLGD